MTREEAIKMAKADLKCAERDTSGQDEMCNSHKCDECSLNYERGNMGEQKEWLRLAIKALEQEPCEDAVSRQAVIDMTGLSEWFDSSDSYNEFVIALSELPSVTPREPKTGHWKHIQYEETLCCSECGCRLFDEQTYIPLHYCPNCGAEMQEVKE